MTGFQSDGESIVTERLTLTALTVHDADEMVGVLNDERLHAFIGGRPDTITELRDRYRRFVAGPKESDDVWLNWIVRSTHDGSAVGTVQATVSTLSDARTVADVAWVIGMAWQGQGYAGEAALALVDWLRTHGVDEVTARIRALRLSGIYFLEEHRRAYPRGMLAANVIGYVGVDGSGLAGVEHSFDSFVRGKAGRVTLLRDARRGMYLVGGEGANRAIDGNHVVLTIDSVVQFIAERALARAVYHWRAAGGSAIVMDPSDGSVLAMASVPTFDPNRYRDFAPAVWRNRNVQDIYEPGSTFKIVTAAAALEEGVVTPSQIVDCGDGVIRIANNDIHEAGGTKYGFITFEDVMVHSSNVGAVRVGARRLAVDRSTSTLVLPRAGRLHLVATLRSRSAHA